METVKSVKYDDDGGKTVLFSKTTNVTEHDNQTGAHRGCSGSITVSRLSLWRISGTTPSILITGSFVASSQITFEQGEGSVWRSASVSAVVHAPVCKLWGRTETERQRQRDRVSQQHCGPELSRPGRTASNVNNC